MQIFKYNLVLSSITMETICIKLEGDFMRHVEQVMKEHNYSTKTEFVRESMRDKIKDLETKKALMRLDKIYGSMKKKHGHITDEDVHRAGEEAFRKIAKKHGVDLD